MKRSSGILLHISSLPSPYGIGDLGQAAREFVVFTGKRVMVLDVQGITGSRKSITSLPYSRVQYFSVRTPGFGELIPESELQLVFFGGYTAKFAFKGNIDIEKLTAAVAAQVL